MAHGVARGQGIPHGDSRGMAKGHGNALTTALGRAIGLVARAFGRGNGPGVAKGRGNGPGMAKGRGNGAAHGRGFAHASVGNPGHNALSTRSSHSQNTSHEEGSHSHDNGNFSSHSQLGHSLAEDPISKSTNADQASQVGDQAPDSVQTDPDQQADPAKAVNPNTIHSDPRDVLTLRVQLVSDLPANNAGELNPDTIHSGHDRFVVANLTSPKLQADRGETSDPDVVTSDLDIAMTRRLAPLLALKLDRSEFLPVSQYAEAGPGTIAEYADDTPATLLPDIEKYRVRKLQSIGDELNDDDEINAAAWKLVPFYAVALVLIFPLLLALKKL